MRLGIKSMKRARKFRDYVAGQKDFRYVEKGTAIFYPDTPEGERPMAMALKQNGSWKLGLIRRSCENFEVPSSNFLCTPKRVAWTKRALGIVLKYNELLPKKKTEKK